VAVGVVRSVEATTVVTEATVPAKDRGVSGGCIDWASDSRLSLT
jgi:hypothetical protein